MELDLQEAWEERLKVCMKGKELDAKGQELQIKGRMLHKGRLELSAEDAVSDTKGVILNAEGDVLRAEGIRLRAEANMAWEKLILETFGNVFMSWENWNWDYYSYECHLSNGQVYGFDNIKREV